MMQNLELAYVAVAYSMTGIMLYVSRHHTYPTVSHIALHKKSTRLVFFWGLFLASTLFAFLMYGWLIPHFSLGIWTKLVVGVLVVSVTFAGLFPVDSKRYKNVHLFFGTMLGIGMFTLLVMLAAATTLHQAARVADGLAAGGMLVLIGSAWRIKTKNYLLHEKIFFALWHTAIFISVYFG